MDSDSDASSSSVGLTRALAAIEGLKKQDEEEDFQDYNEGDSVQSFVLPNLNDSFSAASIKSVISSISDDFRIPPVYPPSEGQDSFEEKKLRKRRNSIGESVYSFTSNDVENDDVSINTSYSRLTRKSAGEGADAEDQMEKARVQFNKEDIRQAVEKLSIEKAMDIHNHLEKSYLKGIASEIDAVLLDQRIQNRRVVNEMSDKYNDIDQVTRNEIALTVKNYTEQMNNLRHIQNKEVDDLRARWQFAHEKAEISAKRSISDKYHTSRMLAGYSMFDDAKVIRDRTHNTEKALIQKLTAVPGKQFMEQFNLMNKRHKTEMTALYNKMNDAIKNIIGQSKVAKSFASAQSRVKQSFTPVRTIHYVHNNPRLNVDEKREIITAVKKSAGRTARTDPATINLKPGYADWH